MRWPRNDEGEKQDKWKIDLWKRLEGVFGSGSDARLLAYKRFWIKEYEGQIREFVGKVMNRCKKCHAAWITVPQLPVVDDGSKNRINRILAEATMDWKLASKFKGRLVLPIVFTNQSQLNSKPMRDKKLENAVKCYELSGAEVLWIVDSSLSDQERNERFDRRYSNLIIFHEAAKKEFPSDTITVAGPYWGVNLVLWVRGLCDHPATSLGTGYKYYISCGQPSKGNVRLAIPPLRRWVVAGELKSWLRDSLNKISPTDPNYRDFEDIINHLSILQDKRAAAGQVARFQKKWFDEIEIVPQVGRALALYQDLSKAFVLGRQLRIFPKEALPNLSAAAREPGKFAEQLMMKCL